MAYISRRFNTAEINGSFYSLQTPERYESWFKQTPDDFIFSVKGPRIITHLKRLKNCENALANFFASGVLKLSHKLGPMLWQLPPRFVFDAERIGKFLDTLPRTTHEAAELSKKHDDKVTKVFLKNQKNLPLTHSLEVRHSSFQHDEYLNLLREKKITSVVADTAGKWPCIEEITSATVYLRLHGHSQLYVSGYSNKSLQKWAEKIAMWQKHHDVYVYFDNTTKGKAPYNALTLAEKLAPKV